MIVKGDSLPCRRCSELPRTNFKGCQVYLYVPTKHHIEPIEELLESLKKDYNFHEDYFLFKVEDFMTFVKKIEGLGLNHLDQKDIKVLPIDSKNKLSFDGLKNLRSLEAWIALCNGGVILDILKSENIKILFQPIIDVKNKKIYGYEALCRGYTSNGSIISPDILFKKAKEMDLIFHLDRLCREQAIQQAYEAGIKEKLFINFLPTAIYDPRKCLQTTDAAVKKTDLYPSQITFEVVETEYIEDFNHLNYILNYYKEKGYSTALDDMGSGYATEDSLISLSPDYMKIDMDIIRGIHLDSKKQGQLKKYLKIIKEKNTRALAEGIESKEELDYVMNQGVALVQGYYFAKPSETLVALDLEELFL